jgi:hypothetical protein
MRLSHLGCFVALLAVATSSAYASSVTMRGGSGSEPFGTLTFSIELTAPGTLFGGNNCVGNAGCVYQNETDLTLTGIDFTLLNPPAQFKPYTCSVVEGTGSPFGACDTTSLPGEVTFSFFDGSLAQGGEFALRFYQPFPAGTTLEATATTPEPPSAILLWTALAGILLVAGRKILGADGSGRLSGELSRKLASS